MKNKGFSLTELLSVIIIMGIILAIVIPVTRSIMDNNEDKKLQLYVETVEKALYAYADMELADGGSADDVTLEKLKKMNYLSSDEVDGFKSNTSFTVEKNADGIVTIKQLENDELKITFMKDDNKKTCTKSRCN